MSNFDTERKFLEVLYEKPVSQGFTGAWDHSREACPAGTMASSFRFPVLSRRCRQRKSHRTEPKSSGHGPVSMDTE